MDHEETKTGEIYRHTDRVVVELVQSYSYEKRKACNWGQGEFGIQEEREHARLEAATEQRLEKTEKTLCVL
jgi:hypothetical protein